MNRKTIVGAIATALVLGLLGGDVRDAAAAESKMDRMVTEAKTAGDHAALATQYDELAKAARAKAEEHRAMAAAYRRAGGAAVKAQLPEHCDGLVTIYEGAAKDYAAMAAAHRELAKSTK